MYMLRYPQCNQHISLSNKYDENSYCIRFIPHLNVTCLQVFALEELTNEEIDKLLNIL